MSSKTGKRRSRRANTNDEDKREPDVIDISDDWSTTSNETERDDSFKETKDAKEAKEIKEVKEMKELSQPDGQKENGGPDNQPDKPEKQTEKKVDNKTDKKINNKTDKKTEAGDEATNGQEMVDENGQPEENGSPTDQIEIVNGQIDLPTPEENSDIEPLVLDSEDSELQLPSECSEASEMDKSPVLTRCKTRRSQAKNAPTPKTPKTLEFEAKDEYIEEEDTSSDKTDLTIASIVVNVGDLTRNNDITTTSIADDTNASSFLETTKDKSYGETLRCLTGRKTVRAQNYNYKPRFYNSNIDISSKDRLDGPKSYTFAPVSGVKRKLDAESPGEQKKSKIDDSPGFFSYLSSPFKSKKDIPSSTPKLTGFKFVHPNSIDEIAKVDEVDTKETKKWCSVM